MVKLTARKRSNLKAPDMVLPYTVRMIAGKKLKKMAAARTAHARQYLVGYPLSSAEAGILALPSGLWIDLRVSTMI